MSYNATLSTTGRPGTTTAASCANTAKSLAELGVPIVDVDGQLAVGCLVSVETYDARIQFNTQQNAQGHVLAQGASYLAAGPELVKALKLVNKTSGSVAALTITVFF